MEPNRIELPTGLGVGPANAWLFTTPEPILVDAGVKTEACWLALQDQLVEQGVAVRDLARVVITHPHVDHFGLAARIVNESDATVWICELGAPWLSAERGRWEARLDYYRRDFLPSTGLPSREADMIMAGMRALESLAEPVPDECIVRFRPDGVLQLGGRSWQVLHAPGHTSTQTCFYQPESRQLISADMLLAVTPTPIVEDPPDGSAERVPALPAFLDSLEVLDRLDIDQVLPGHGRPFRNHRQVIARQRERIEQRKLECFAYVRQGVDNIPDLVERMYAHQPPGMRLTGLWMLVGYLDLLLAEGLVREEIIDGVWHFAPVEDVT